MVFARLRIELPDHPGALAAASRVLATQGLNVVEVSIHEVEGQRAVDEIVVLAAPDARDASLVVLAARPYAIRFTATELNRLAAVLDCRRLLALVGRARWHDEAPDSDGRMPWGRGLVSNA